MTERQLSKAIVQYAELQGWRVFTISNTRASGLRSHSGIGFPDLFMVRNGVAIAAELKVKGRELTDAQWGWLNALASVHGIQPCVWREKEWTSGVVEEMLR